MSFVEQERVLFDLLFDKSLRENFRRVSTLALTDYALDKNELDDFKGLRVEAIELDASMRTYLILTQLCRQFPVTFSLVAPLDQGMILLRDGVNLAIMRCELVQRAVEFGRQLQKALQVFDFKSAKEQRLIMAILDAELAMAWSSTALKRQLLDGRRQPVEQLVTEMHADWLDRPVRLAAYVSASIIPQSYSRLKQQLCRCQDVELWAYLCKKKMTASMCRRISQAEAETTLFITRAQVIKLSRFEPVIDYKTIELAEGFASLLESINGLNSIAYILQQLQSAGATESLLGGVREGFRQLLSHGILELVEV